MYANCLQLLAFDGPNFIPGVGGVMVCDVVGMCLQLWKQFEKVTSSELPSDIEVGVVYGQG